MYRWGNTEHGLFIFKSVPEYMLIDFLERREEAAGGGTGDRTHNLLVHRTVLPPAEPHQPGLEHDF